MDLIEIRKNMHIEILTLFHTYSVREEYIGSQYNNIISFCNHLKILAPFFACNKF